MQHGCVGVFIPETGGNVILVQESLELVERGLARPDLAGTQFIADILQIQGSHTCKEHCSQESQCGAIPTTSCTALPWHRRHRGEAVCSGHRLISAWHNKGCPSCKAKLWIWLHTVEIKTVGASPIFGRNHKITTQGLILDCFDQNITTIAFQ